ncbi:MAG: hypothetical protein QW505_00635 [Thermoplasmata archaeon]
MNLIEWLKYKLHGVVWRIPVWIIVLLIAVLIIVNAAVFVYQPWPHAVFSADITYQFQKENISNSGYHIYIIISGPVTNIGNANGTCSIEIRVFEEHIGEHLEVFDIGTLSPGAKYEINWKHYLFSYPDGTQVSPEEIMSNIEVTYRLFY